MERLRQFSRQQSVRQFLKIVGTILITVFFVVLFVQLAIPAILRVDWPDWTGFNTYTKQSDTVEREKTLWDWMQLLIVPAALAIGGYIYNRTEKQLEHQRIEERAASEQKRAEETQREAALQTYLDQMADLLLKGLRSSEAGSEVRDIARIRTLTTLRRLDSARCTIVFRFLHDAKLVTNTSESIVNLKSANFSQQNLAGTYVGAVYLREANLTGANLTGANLGGPDFSEPDLSGGLDLSGFDLSGLNLGGATVTNDQLASCTTLRGATLPDRTKVPDNQDFPPGWK